MDMTDNLHRKAQSCRADLEFLLTVFPETGFVTAKDTVKWAIRTLTPPTEEKITSAWQLAALIHENIRKHGIPDNDIREN